MNACRRIVLAGTPEFDASEHPYYTTNSPHSAYTKTPESESTVPNKEKSQNVPECPTESDSPTNDLSAAHTTRPALNFTITRKMLRNVTKCYRKTGDHMPNDNTISTIALNDGAVTIKWTDGEVNTLSAKYLRVNCACAECVEEWTNRKLLDPATVSANIQAEDYLMVGKYAVQFLWSDGHYTGIYPFDMLRSLVDRQSESG